MSDLMELLIAFVIVFTVFIVGIFGISFVATYISQNMEKASFGDFKYKISDRDTSWYVTNSYKIDKHNCVNFIDNYGQAQKFCEKYSIGEYYFHKNSPTLRTIWYGY